MRMPPLEIDFSARRRLASPLGWLLLAAGGVAMALVSLDHLAALDALRLVEVEQARLSQQREQAQPAGRSGRSELEQAELKSAQRTAAQLNLPWNALLATLERSADPNVALLSFESEGQTRQLHLMGEARTIDDVVVYAQRLDQSSQVAAVTLSRHEQRRVEQESVIRFTLDVDWSRQ